MDETWTTYILSPCWLSLKKAGIKIRACLFITTCNVGFVREKKEKINHRQTTVAWFVPVSRCPVGVGNGAGCFFLLLVDF